MWKLREALVRGHVAVADSRLMYFSFVYCQAVENMHPAEWTQRRFPGSNHFMARGRGLSLASPAAVGSLKYRGKRAFDGLFRRRHRELTFFRRVQRSMPGCCANSYAAVWASCTPLR